MEWLNWKRLTFVPLCVFLASCASVGPRHMLRSVRDIERDVSKLVLAKTGVQVVSLVSFLAKNERPGGCDEYFIFAFDDEGDFTGWLIVPTIRDSAIRLLPEPLRPFSLTFFVESVVRNHLDTLFGKRSAVVTLDLVVPRLPCGMYDRPYWHVIASTGRDYYLDPFADETLDGESFRKKVCDEMRDSNGLRYGEKQQ